MFNTNICFILDYFQFMNFRGIYSTATGFWVLLCNNVYFTLLYSKGGVQQVDKINSFCFTYEKPKCTTFITLIRVYFAFNSAVSKFRRL